MIDFAWILAGVAAGTGSIIMWIFVGRPLITKYSRKGFIDGIRGIRDDPEAKEAFHILLSEGWTWFHTPAIETGRVLTDDKGKESKEIITPFQNMASETGRYAEMRLKSSLGVAGRKAQVLRSDLVADLTESELGGTIAAIAPRAFERAMKDGDYMPILIDMVRPLIESKITDMVNKGGGSGSSWR